MSKRENVKPVLRWMPKWMLVLLVVVLFPVYIVAGASFGAYDALHLWMSELDEVQRLEP